MLGGRRFDAHGQSVSDDCPSQSFTLRNLGSRLEAWLRKTSALGGHAPESRSSIWRAWNGPTSKPSTVRPSHRSSRKISPALNPAKLRLRLQPYIQLLDLRYPVDDLLLEVRKDCTMISTSPAMLSANATNENASVLSRSLNRARFFWPCIAWMKMSISAACEREEFAILSRCTPVNHSTPRSKPRCEARPSLPQDRAAQVENWFHTWSALGWFCRLEKYPKITKAASS